MKKTILITGCSSGFGKTTTRYFVERGWNVVATMRRPELETELTTLDGVLVTRLDVQDPASIEQAIAAGIERFGAIDAVANNAGFGLFGIFEATPPEKVGEQFGVNLFGVMNVIRAVLPHFRERKSGVILNIGSGAGVFGLPMISLYSASKFALSGFSEALSYELAAVGVQVKLIEPGGVVSTKFGERSAAEASQTENLSDYEEFVGHTMKLFESLRGQRLASEEQVASVIFEAANDGTDQLRYVATDDIKPLVKARRETSEGEYMALMRGRFGFSF